MKRYFRNVRREWKNKAPNSTTGIAQQQKREDIRIVTWNVKGLTNRKKLLREIDYMMTFDVIILMETWIEEKSKAHIEEILPGNYE